MQKELTHRGTEAYLGGIIIGFQVTNSKYIIIYAISSFLGHLVYRFDENLPSLLAKKQNLLNN